MAKFLALLDKSTKVAFGVAFAGIVIASIWPDPDTLRWVLWPTLAAIGVLLVVVARLLWKAIAYVSKSLWNWGWRRTAIFRLDNVTRRHRLLLLWIAKNPDEALAGSPLVEPYRALLLHGFLFRTDRDLYEQAFKVNRCVYWHGKRIGEVFEDHIRDAADTGQPRTWQ